MSRQKSRQVPYHNNYSTDSLGLKDCFFIFHQKDARIISPFIVHIDSFIFTMCLLTIYFCQNPQNLTKTKTGPDLGPVCRLTFNYFAGVTEVMWGFTPLYQYRKPSISILSPIFRFLTALYTSESTPQRSLSTVKV